MARASSPVSSVLLASGQVYLLYTAARGRKIMVTGEDARDRDKPFPGYINLHPKT